MGDLKSIPDTEVALTAGMSLLGRLPVPAHGLGMILLHTLTVCIQNTEVVLTAGTSLLGGLPQPAHGLGVVLFRTLTVFIHDTEVVLSAGMSLLGGAPPQPKRTKRRPVLARRPSGPSARPRQRLASPLGRLHT